ncbi:MAG: urease accessory protein [Burkholderiaceae bacterium]
MTLFSILVVGLLLGMKHATEADHLAAVATLVTRQGSLAQTLQQGVAWGVGHTLTLMVFAGAVFVLGEVISPRLEHALETAVGIMLIVLGADVLRRLIRDRIHFHVHRHGPAVEHVHAHSHRGEGLHERSQHRHAHAKRWPLRALAVGVMHGLAGSAALVVLSLKSVPSLSLGLVYVAVFGVGSIIGMAILSIVIALPLRISARFSAGYLAGLHRSMTALVGVFSCTLGLAMVLRLGYF